uniref:Uncharacterized protein n=1 Tax=Arundo donax TaxID=35708 RepID=A0A0A9D724_ARUDO
MHTRRRRRRCVELRSPPIPPLPMRSGWGKKGAPLPAWISSLGSHRCHGSPRMDSIRRGGELGRAKPTFSTLLPLQLASPVRRHPRLVAHRSPASMPTTWSQPTRERGRGSRSPAAVSAIAVKLWPPSAVSAPSAALARTASSRSATPAPALVTCAVAASRAASACTTARRGRGSRGATVDRPRIRSRDNKKRAREKDLERREKERERDASCGF